MAELLVFARPNETHTDPEKDRRGCWKRGMPEGVKPDGHGWGALEQLPRYAIFRFPGISIARLERYAEEELHIDQFTARLFRYRRRRWMVRWNDLPQAARDTIQATGGLTIAAGGYAGPADYTWAQVKQYFRNCETGLDETEDLT